MITVFIKTNWQTYATMFTWCEKNIIHQWETNGVDVIETLRHFTPSERKKFNQNIASDLFVEWRFVFENIEEAAFFKLKWFPIHIEEL